MGMGISVHGDENEWPLPSFPGAPSAISSPPPGLASFPRGGSPPTLGVSSGLQRYSLLIQSCFCKLSVCNLTKENVGCGLIHGVSGSREKRMRTPHILRLCLYELNSPQDVLQPCDFRAEEKHQGTSDITCFAALSRWAVKLSLMFNSEF